MKIVAKFWVLGVIALLTLPNGAFPATTILPAKFSKNCPSDFADLTLPSGHDGSPQSPKPEVITFSNGLRFQILDSQPARELSERFPDFRIGLREANGHKSYTVIDSSAEKIKAVLFFSEGPGNARISIDVVRVNPLAEKKFADRGLSHSLFRSLIADHPQATEVVLNGEMDEKIASIMLNRLGFVRDETIKTTGKT